MFDASLDPIAEEPSPVDPTVEVSERHQRLLAEVGEIAMEVTRALGASAVVAGKEVEEVLATNAWHPETARARALAGSKDAADAFSKVTRALRLTFALEKATAEALRDLRAGVLPERKATAAAKAQKPGDTATAPAAPLDALREKVRDLVTHAIVAACDITPARELSDDLGERLTETDNFALLLRRPLREVVEQICTDIDCYPEWIRLMDDDPAPFIRRPNTRSPAHPVRAMSIASATRSRRRQILIRQSRGGNDAASPAFSPTASALAPGSPSVAPPRPALSPYDCWRSTAAAPDPSPRRRGRRSPRR
jgi:hypothetical protein